MSALKNTLLTARNPQESTVTRETFITAVKVFGLTILASSVPYLLSMEQSHKLVRALAHRCRRGPLGIRRPQIKNTCLRSHWVINARSTHISTFVAFLAVYLTNPRCKRHTQVSDFASILIIQNGLPRHLSTYRLDCFSFLLLQYEWLRLSRQPRAFVFIVCLTFVSK